MPSPQSAAADSLATATAESSLWPSVLLVVMTVVAILLLLNNVSLRRRLQQLTSKRSELDIAKSSTVDMDSLLGSINHAGPLYKELSRLCHPDRFVGTSNESIAQRIFQDISANRRKFDKLVLLAREAETELSVIVNFPLPPDENPNDQ